MKKTSFAGGYLSSYHFLFILRFPLVQTSPSLDLLPIQLLYNALGTCYSPVTSIMLGSYADPYIRPYLGIEYKQTLPYCFMLLSNLMGVGRV